MPRFLLDEDFDRPVLNPQLRWLNAPKEWFLDAAASRLVLQPDAETDFWQRTHYGFSADNGHFLYAPVHEDFSMVVRVSFHPRNQYDQAGLMVRFSEQCWLKASVEYEPEGPSKLGVVATNGGFSDWSLQNFPQGCQTVELRVELKSTDVLVEYRVGPESDWTLIRVTHLNRAQREPALCGLYACSPKGSGFRAEFARLTIVSRQCSVCTE